MQCSDFTSHNMLDFYASATPQKSGVVSIPDVYAPQQLCSNLDHVSISEPHVKNLIQVKADISTHQPEQYQERHQRREVDAENSERQQQSYTMIAALEQQRRECASIAIFQQQRLLDIQESYIQLQKRFQLDRIIRSKEAAAKVEALNRRMQQYEAEAAWRQERNSYIREDVFKTLHWKLTQKKTSDANTQLRKLQRTFQKEVSRFVKAETLSRNAQHPPSCPAADTCPSCSSNDASEATVSKAKPESATAKVETAAFCNSPTTDFAATSSQGVIEKASASNASDLVTAEVRAARAAPAFDSSATTCETKLEKKTNVGACHLRPLLHACMPHSRGGAAPKTLPSAPSPSTFSSCHSLPRKSLPARSEPVFSAFTASESCSNSTVPLHLQLLALCYKREMAAVELQHRIHPCTAAPRRSLLVKEHSRPETVTGYFDATGSDAISQFLQSSTRQSPLGTSVSMQEKQERATREDALATGGATDRRGNVVTTFSSSEPAASDAATPAHAPAAESAGPDERRSASRGHVHAPWAIPQYKPPRVAADDACLERAAAEISTEDGCPMSEQ